MKTGKVFLSVFLTLVFVAPVEYRVWAAPGQAASAAPKMGQNSQSPALTLDVVVAGKSGEPVSGLQPGDFKLFDNKQPQELVSVAAAGGVNAKADPPVEVILLIDDINASQVTIHDELNWLHKYLDKASGGQLALPISFAVLTDQGVVSQDRPSRDAKALGRYLDNSRIGLRALRNGSGMWGAMEREESSLKALDFLADKASKRPGRKLLIWISPGWHGISDAGRIPSRKDQQDTFDMIVDTSVRLRRARLTLDSIDPTSNFINPYYESYLKGVTEPKHADYGNLMLQVLAIQSGGQVMAGNIELPALIDRCVADASAYYVLTFNPPPAAHPDEYHELSVEIAKPGLKARTRTGYYAQPASAVASSADGQKLSQ
jgi:VWFA-related protein